MHEIKKKKLPFHRGRPNGALHPPSSPLLLLLTRFAIELIQVNFLHLFLYFSLSFTAPRHKKKITWFYWWLLSLYVYHTTQAGRISAKISQADFKRRKRKKKCKNNNAKKRLSQQSCLIIISKGIKVIKNADTRIYGILLGTCVR